MTNQHADLTMTPEITDKYSVNRRNALEMILNLTTAIEAVMLDPDDECDTIHSLQKFFSDNGGYDWMEMGIEENTFEFKILNSLYEIGVDLLDR